MNVIETVASIKKSNSWNCVRNNLELNLSMIRCGNEMFEELGSQLQLKVVSHQEADLKNQLFWIEVKN